MSDARREEALIEMMFLAVHADGEFGEEERNVFAEGVHTLTHGRVAGAAFKEIMARIEAELAKAGRAGRIAALKSAFPDDASREEALAAVVKMVAADGVVRTAERELILEVAEGLGIEGDRAADLVARHS